MKKLILITAIIFFNTCLLVAQTPQKMSYQAVVRDASNALVTNQSVGMQISILQGSATGTAVYVERHFPSTNANGLVSIEIGAGTVVSGDFSTIDWANGPYFIKTETDPNGGSNYTITGTSQLLSVPYALYAGKADNVFSGDFNDLSNVPSGLSDGDDVNDADHDPNNEIQDISLSGNNLSISNGSTVDLSTVTPANTWSLNGNAGTNPGTDFIGTTDNKDLVFKRNNVSAGILGFYNTAIGVETLANNTTGYFNTATGYGALYSNTTGNKNTASGDNALYSNTTGQDNIASGYKALYSNTTGNYNTASGSQALYSNTIGHSNVAIGVKALYKNTIRSNLVAVGDSALYHNGQGATFTDPAKFNTALGSKALYSNTTGSSNTATGINALYSNTTGDYNTTNGAGALFSNTTGRNNIAIGTGALSLNTTGSYNTAIGGAALHQNDMEDYNTALGSYAFYGGLTYHNSTALGYYANISASNQVRIGNTSVNSIGGYTNWSNVSDERFKRDVQENVPGLSFIKKLRPVTYHLDMDAIAKFNHTPDSLRLKDAERQKAAMLQTGFIAQEVEQAAQSLGYEFSGVDAPKNENDYYGLRYAEFVVPLVKAVQEQQKTIEQQQKEIDELKTLVKKLLNKNGNK